MERIAAMRSGPEAALRRAAAGGGRPDGGAPAPAAGQRRLFGGTPEQTAAALFAHPRPAFDIDPDITLMIRKAWDIGTRSVVMQTTLQIDGDVTQAMARSLLDRPAEQRDFLLQLHAAATRDGIDQWKRFYELLGEIVQTIGTWLFGRR
jgi:hypothetical protein